MKCSDARKTLSALLDGAGEASLRDAVARHVDSCTGCRTELDALSGTDQVVRKAIVQAAGAVSAKYFEDFLPRLEARLDAEPLREDSMPMGTSGSGPGEKDGPGTERSQPQRTDVAGKPVSKVEEVSGLHDIRSLAAGTIHSVRERRGTDSDVAESLLASASPAALGHVVLPAPGKEVAPAAPRMQAGAGAAVTPIGAVEVGGRRSVLPAVLVAGFALAAAAAIVLFVMNDGKPQPPVAAAPQAAAAPSSDDPAPPPAAAPTTTATGASGAVANADEAPKQADVMEPTAVEPEPEATGVPADPAAAKDDGKGKKTAGVAEGKDKKERAAVEKKPEGGQPADPPKEDPAPTKDPEVKPAEGDGKPKSAQDQEIDAILNDAQKKEEKKEEAPVEDAPETLSREDIKKGMGMVRARVQSCYDKYKIPGTVSVKARIEPDGTVSSAEAIDKFAATETGLCVANAVQTAKFRSFKGAPMTLKYPFKLE